MKREEAIANQFLDTLGVGQPIFEPDGNIPPDFSLAKGRIGVEVRRLNKTRTIHNVTQGDDEFSMSFLPSIRGILSEFDELYTGKTYWINIEYARDFRRLTKPMKRKIKSALRGYLSGTSSSPFSISDSLLIHITEGKPVQGRVFRLALSSQDEVDEIVSTYIMNIRRCIQEKTRKITRYHHRYDEWWLVLVDQIGWSALSANEADEIHRSIEKLGLFSKLYVIDNQANLLLEK